MNLVDKLIGCFTKPTAGMQHEMSELERQIPDDYKQAIFDAILEEAPGNARIGVKNIRDACRKVGVSFKDAIFISHRDHTCDCCSHEFKYSPCPTDDAKIDYGIHDICPMCGFQVCWTLQYRDYVNAGHTPEWYAKLLSRFRADTAWGPNKTKGVWFKRADRERERRKDIDTKQRLKMDSIPGYQDFQKNNVRHTV